MASAAQAQTTSITPASHVPSVAGSVLSASDGLGGSVLIRIQNMSCTGKLLKSNIISPSALYFLFQCCRILPLLSSFSY